MTVVKTRTLVIGAGLCGRTVASHLEGECLIIDRGERRSYQECLDRYRAANAEEGTRQHAEELAYRSDLPWNEVPRLSPHCHSRYSLICGGASNWWGGNVRRLPASTFERTDGPISWPFGLSKLEPWYEAAERRLNLAGDPAYNPSIVTATMPGFEHWRYALRPHFDAVGLSSVALNHGRHGGFGQGVCRGRSNCAICYEDAKARPDNLFAETDILPQTLCLRLSFEGDRATRAECFNGRELFEIEFDRCVIAANGIESVALLQRSELPSGTRHEEIGRYFQDHAHVHFVCRTERPLPFNVSGGLAHVYLPEVAGSYRGIEISAFALTHRPLKGSLKDVLWKGCADQPLQKFWHELNRTLTIFCELEMPPDSRYRVNSDDERVWVEDQTYPELIARYDRIIPDIVERLEGHGLRVVDVEAFYRSGYGGHHFCGGLNLGSGPSAVVDEDARLIGTSNVYVSGTSVIPRSGGEGPTLTAIALAERLGASLASGSAA